MICKIKSTKLNSPKYCNVIPTIQFRYTVKEFQVLLNITINSIKYQSFVYTQLNDQTVLFQAIQFSISHLFPLSLNV